MDKYNKDLDQKIDLREILVPFLLKSWWIFLIFLVLAYILGDIRFKSSTKIYQADSLVQFDNNSGFSAMEGISAGGGYRDTRALAEILVRSRRVTGEVATKMGLDILITPHYYPKIGKYFANYFNFNNISGELAPLSFWQGAEYAWGGEVLEISEFMVPEGYINKNLVLEVLADNRFALFDGSKKILESGVDELTIKNGFRIKVDQMIARPSLKFFVRKESISRYLNKIIGNIDIDSRGRNSTGVVRITYNYHDKNKVVDILNNILETLIKAVDIKEVDEIIGNLQTVEQQLPIIEQRLKKAGQALTDFQRQNDDVVVTERQVEVAVGNLIKLKKKKDEAEGRKNELQRIYTSKHPIVKDLVAIIGKLDAEINEAKKKASALPALQVRYVELQNEIEAARALRNNLHEQRQSLQILKSTNSKNAHVIDYAIKPESFIQPSRKKILVIFLLAGALIAFAVAGIRYMRSSVLVTDANDLRDITNIPVWGDVPHALNQKNLHKTGSKIISEADAYGDVAESMRSLRTVINLHILQAKNRHISITSPLPRSGKSFISMNLGYLLAKQHKKVLLIDADMRKGQASSQLGYIGKKGLRELLEGAIDNVEDVIHSTDYENLTIIPSGSRSNISSDVLTSSNFHNLIEFADANFDIVVFDTPPLLALTDATTIGREVGCNILVLPQGTSTKQEVKATLRRSELAGVNFDGIVLNRSSISSVSKYYHKYMRYGAKYGRYSGYGYMYGGYKQKYYKYDEDYGYEAEGLEPQKKAS